ncbi:hypothetical protein [Pararhizobium sp. O133]|uniref:hypothetical protein n=1 Tax=Pararhizobium sp. O133 TaxID=3449278 RepID=UPI003F6884B6
MMPPLVWFVVRNFASGFALGMFAALSVVTVAPSFLIAQLVSTSPVGLWLMIFAYGSTFGLGYLVTALWFMTEDV